MNMELIAKTMATVGKELGQQVVAQAPKYGAKMILGVPCEVGIYFASRKIIKEISKMKEAKVAAEA